MADAKVSDGVNLTGGNTTGDILYVDQGGVDSYVTIDNFGVQGTFTATLTAATPPTTPPTTTAYYRIIGNWVDLQLVFSNVDTSGASGELKITGLPAAILAAVSQYGTAWAYNVATSTLSQESVVISQEIKLTEDNNLSALNIIAGTGKYLRINISYRI